MKKSLLLLSLAGFFATPAYADFTGKDASAATITFKNPNTCSSVVCVPVFQIYDGTNLVTLTTAGADAVSNTLTGVPIYGRNLVFNGTTWDRWQGIVKIASGGVAAGGLAAGAGVDGWDLTEGATTDAAATAGSTGSVSAKLRLITTQLNTVATSTKQSDGTQKSQTVDASGNVLSAPLAPTVSATAEATHVIKSSAGQVQGCYAVNLTSTPGFLILLNATSAPADGAVTPMAVAVLPPNGSASIGGALLNPLTFGTGITAVLTSATTPFTKTTGVITGYISCQAI